MAILTSLTYVKNVTSGTIRRVAKHNARVLVNTGKWQFCKKSEWKAQQRASKK